MAFFESTTGRLDAATRRQTVIHEMSHLVDAQGPLWSHDPYSEMPFFQAAFKVDVNDRTIDQISKDGFFRYTDSKEAFAEAMSRQIQPADQQEDFDRDFPNTTAAARLLLTKMHVEMAPSPDPNIRAKEEAALLARKQVEERAIAEQEERQHQAEARAEAEAKAKNAVENALRTTGTYTPAAMAYASIAYSQAIGSGSSPEEAIKEAIAAGRAETARISGGMPSALISRGGTQPPMAGYNPPPGVPRNPLMPPNIPSPTSSKYGGMAPPPISRTPPVTGRAGTFRVGPGLPPGGTFAPAQN